MSNNKDFEDRKTEAQNESTFIQQVTDGLRNSPQEKIDSVEPDPSVLAKLKNAEFKVLSSKDYLLTTAPEEKQRMRRMMKVDSIIETSYAQLSEKFGIPLDPPSGDNKVLCSWKISIGGILVDIYDYKLRKQYFGDGRGLSDAEIMSNAKLNWNVKATSNAVIAAFRTYLGAI